MPDTPTGENSVPDQTTGRTPNDQTDATTTQVVDPAPPSGASDVNNEAPENTGANEPSTMADVIAQALGADPTKTPEAKAEDGDKAGPGDNGEKPAGSEGDTSTATAEIGDDNEPDTDPTEDELRGYKPAVAKRVKKLLHQRNTARREAESYRPDAESYRNVRQFMGEHGLKDAEVADLFKFGALVKSTDPAHLDAALDMVLPIVQNLLAATGRVVPDDLKAKVDAGEITEDLARQMSRERNRAALSAREVERVRERTAQQEHAAAQTAQARLADEIRSATAAWYNQVQASDPDFGLKADAMQDAALAIVARRGLPKSPAEAVEYAKEAHRRATQFLQAGRPAPRATRPAPSSDGSNGNRANVAPQPSSLEEAILGALRGSQS